MFIRLRWADNGGNAYCPHCGCTTVYMARRPNGAARWRCKACRKDFSVTSGTLFAFHKMPLRSYLMAIAIFANEVKGKSMLALSRDLGTQYKTAFVLAHKIREAMAVRGSPSADRRRRQEGGNRRCIFWRPCEAGQPEREPPRSPAPRESKRQAQGRGCHPRARRQHAARRIPH